ncbi:MAG: hypothetical protein HC850_08010 [Rhodomicrobium sp.]|nr:hypothetical protein [Rhodomicrobium sp.]
MAARALIAALAVALIWVHSAHAAPSRLKGLTALSKELSARIAPEDSPIELDRYMPADGLDDLVGKPQRRGCCLVVIEGKPAGALGRSQL